VYRFDNNAFLIFVKDTNQAWTNGSKGLWAMDTTPDGGALSFGIYGVGDIGVGQGPAVPLNQWTFVAMTYTTSTHTFNAYTNGKLSYSTSAYTNTADNVGDGVYIGEQQVGQGYGYTNGIIDDVHFYQRALSSGDITQLYLYGSLGTYSNNYIIQSDALVPSGGSWSSAGYIFRDTMGEVSICPAKST